MDKQLIISQTNTGSSFENVLANASSTNNKHKNFKKCKPNKKTTQLLSRWYIIHCGHKVYGNRLEARW